MKILAIETSCDETAISIVQKIGKTFRVLANIVSSQAKLHAVFGGVVPNLASREHQKNLVPILIAALKEAKLYKLKKLSSTSVGRRTEVLQREPILENFFRTRVLPLDAPAIDAIAVTHGPGLEPALWVGINFAKALAVLWKKPLIPINHMEGHIFSALIEQKKELRTKNLKLRTARFPALALLVSGGHTEIILMKKFGVYTILGETVDDAAGEAFDKVAKMLKLGYPGGPIISRLAENGNPEAIAFPRPMIKADNFNFSFSGLKTSVLYYLRDHPALRSKRYALYANVAASFQQAVVDVLVSKILRAIKKYKAKTLILGGGVAANKLLRVSLRDSCGKGVLLFFPDPKLTGDNALMIALTAFFKKNKSARSIHADGNLKLG